MGGGAGRDGMGSSPRPRPRPSVLAGRETAGVEGVQRFRRGVIAPRSTAPAPAGKMGLPSSDPQNRCMGPSRILQLYVQPQDGEELGRVKAVDGASSTLHTFYGSSLPHHLLPRPRSWLQGLGEHGGTQGTPIPPPGQADLYPQLLRRQG